MASLSFMQLALNSLACRLLLLLAGNNAFASAAATSSEEEISKDFQQHRTSNILDGDAFNYLGFMENVSTTMDDETPHGEIGAETMKRVHLNFNHSMLNKRRVATECDLFSGTWVRDDSYPLYPAGQCPYLLEGRVNCKQNGRPDSDYEKWRWQPQGCSIPRFNAKDMLWWLRGKRLMFVGDSISRNHWESMVCIFQTVIPSKRRTMINRNALTMFKALDYKASVEFMWAPFLVQHSMTHTKKRILRLDSVGKNGIYWKGVDVLVFETSHWWDHGKGVTWDSIMEGKRLYRDMDPMLAYKKALTTWANWESANIDPNKSLVFYRTMSPTHESSSLWNDPNGQRCYKQRDPVQILEFIPPVLSEVAIAKQVVKITRFPVTLLDITAMSEYRKDGHPSVYSNDFNRQQRKNPVQFGDCSHWCLPGVPDTWNELHYASLISKGFGMV